MKFTNSPSPAPTNAALYSSVIPSGVAGARDPSWISAYRTLLSFTFLLLLPTSLLATKHPQYGGTLRIELQLTKISLDPREWKPGALSSGESAKLAALVYDRLLILDDYGRFQPTLATDWSHDSALKTWQFKIRPGVKFSDASPLTAKEVTSALQSLLPPGFQVTASENSITIHSTRPVPDLLEQLASGRYFVFRVTADNTLLGTGPFFLDDANTKSLAELTPSIGHPVHIKFRANEDAWAGRPFLDAIDVTLGNPALRQILDLEVSRADIIDISPDLVRKARQDNLRVWSSPPATLLALRFDPAQPLAADPRLREILDLALDRDTMANVLLQRQALPASALLPQWLSGYAFLFGSPMNLDRAKQIRASLPANVAGGADPLRLRVDSTGDLMKLLGERVAVNARQANISVQLVSHTAASSPTANSPAAGLHLFAWHYDSLSPRTEFLDLARYLHATLNPESLPDTMAPDKLYAEEHRLLEEREVLPLLLLPDYVAIAPAVRNWTVAPAGEWRLADVWLEPSQPATSSSYLPQTQNPAPGVHP
jgi:peptide/nickel transport system substrate-binding protein